MEQVVTADPSAPGQPFYMMGALAFGFLASAGYIVSMLGILYVTMAVAPNLTQRSATALRERNFRSFFAGLGVSALVFIVLLIGHNAPPLQFLALLGYGVLLIPGYASAAEDIGRRLYWASGKEGSRAAHLASGWLVFAFGSLFPVIGWFVVLPYVTCSAVGSLVVGAFAGRPRDIEFPKE